MEPQSVLEADATAPETGRASRVDLHCHSAASRLTGPGVQRALGLPECATPPEEVYLLAKRRGMDFVTITDHDTIAGVLEIADREDVFVSEELTAHFRGEPEAAVHVLCYGIEEDDHEWLQAHSADVERCAAYLHEHGIACSLAHPFYAVRAPLAPRHWPVLARLFPVWETRNGSRAPELNMPAVIATKTRGDAGTAGSDDHAGVDIGRTFTETPWASTPEEFLEHVRSGRVTPCGAEGSAAKWAHAAVALAARVLGQASGETPDPQVVLTMMQRAVESGDFRGSVAAGSLDPEHARKLLGAWLGSIGFEEPTEIVELMQGDDFSHDRLFRVARSAHDEAVRRELSSSAPSLFEACVPMIPYLPAIAFVGLQSTTLRQGEERPPRVALVLDETKETSSAALLLAEIRRAGVPGFDVELIGTGPHVDARLPVIAELTTRSRPGMRLSVPSLPSIVEKLAGGRYDLIHLASNGPTAIAAACAAGILSIPTVGSCDAGSGFGFGATAGDQPEAATNGLLEELASEAGEGGEERALRRLADRYRLALVELDRGSAAAAERAAA